MSTPPDQRHQDLVAEISQRIGRELATKTVLFHEALAGRIGLGSSDLKCLDLLRGSHTPLTAKNLVELTGLTGGAITGVADRLETAGFVERVRDPADRRRWELRPLPGRQQDTAALFAPLGAAMADLCAGYTGDELEVVGDFLVKLGLVLDEQTRRLRE